MALITCEGLVKKYGNMTALSDFSIEIPAGRIIGILGPNGSGKTTFIKSLCGVLTPEAGTIRIDGKEVGTESKKIVSYLPERPYFSSAVRVKETLDFFEGFYEDFERKTALHMLSTLQIDLKSKIGSLSKGTREKLQLVLVMSRRAKVYLLDEPMGGVDPAARDFILKTILTNYSEDASVLISTHLISDVEKVLDEVVFIKHGKLALHKPVDDIRMEEKKSVDMLFREVFAC
ncbi:MAG: ABC transporter ATP-binding protein [Lachnospiraceae bacterium]|nr:ABC transporter ATP-binding protein [Lachnospiraceae bacterium]MCI8781035.1 ABC transporter ATP-binding protein [Lachnospiraceae bacterium]